MRLDRGAQETIEALSTNVLRLTEGRQMDADTIDYLRGQVERLDDLVAAMYERSQTKDALVADVTRRMNLAVNLGRMVKEQSDRWQEMAEDLWEELQEWHQVDCPCWSDKNDTIKPSCICHRILEAKWNECTNASDWVEDEWDQAAAP